MKDKLILPVLPLRGIVIYPDMVLNLDALRKISSNAIEHAFMTNQTILLLAQKDASVENPLPDEFYSVGTVAKIKNLIRLKGQGVRVLIEGLYTAKVENLIEKNEYIEAQITERDNRPSARVSMKQEALVRNIIDLMEQYVQINRHINPEIFMNICSRSSEIREFSYMVASNINIPYSEKQIILEAPSNTARLEKIMIFLKKEIEMLVLERKLIAETQEKINKNQREYFLREQLRTIYEELGEQEDVSSEADQYKEMLEELQLSDQDTREKILKEINRLYKMPSGSHESTVIRGYLDTVLELPWNKRTKENRDIIKCERILNKDHYGLLDVKKRIIEYLAAKTQNPDGGSMVLCLVGPPGVGKTSVAASIAKALNRKMVRISLGSVHDEADIRGHRKTYIGAMPGRIIKAVSEAGVKNPLILLDEIDKMGADYKGDPEAALLEVLDKEQNGNFRDHFVEVPFDLSEVLFVTTANTLSTISPALLDRMEIIELSSYTALEKEQIAVKYLLPKQLKEHGVTKAQINIDGSAIRELIYYYVLEAGVRNLEREIGSLIRKAIVILLKEDVKKIKITDKDVSKYLGARKYIEQNDVSFSEPGVVNGLAYTSVGGTMLNIEVNVLHGSGKIELTGQLGDVMKESASAAICYLRANAKELGISPSFYKNKDIHIHVPEGATPKDGPSAGITMATAVYSALTGKAVRRDTAMTGEITIRGRVLAIGGLKEKALAAHREKIYNIIIPCDNMKDLEDIPKELMEDFNFIPVKNIKEVLEYAVLKNKE